MTGLTNEQVQQRIEEGKINVNRESQHKEGGMWQSLELTEN